MQKRTLVALVVGLPVLYAWSQYAGSKGAMHERFPNIDRQIAAKAYRRVLLEVVQGKHPEAKTDEDYDKIFLDIVDRLTSQV